MVSGSLVYQSPHFRQAQNVYHVPQAVVEICDAIQSGDTPVKAVFPGELVQYVRQYNSYIWMPYGREALVERWGFSYELFDLQQEETLDILAFAPLAHSEGCQYIILPEGRKMLGSLSDYGYELLDEKEGYCIYWDSELDWKP